MAVNEPAAVRVPFRRRDERHIDNIIHRPFVSFSFFIEDHIKKKKGSETESNQSGSAAGLGPSPPIRAEDRRPSRWTRPRCETRAPRAYFLARLGRIFFEKWPTTGLLLLFFCLYRDGQRGGGGYRKDEIKTRLRWKAAIKWLPQKK